MKSSRSLKSVAFGIIVFYFLSRNLFLFASANLSSFGFWSVKGLSGKNYEVEFENKTLNVNYPKIFVGIAFNVFQKELEID